MPPLLRLSAGCAARTGQPRGGADRRLPGFPCAVAATGGSESRPANGSIPVSRRTSSSREADGWRAEAWEMMRLRRDLEFFFITKRIGRLREQLPPDWGDGYENVTVGCTVENQAAADLRLPLFLETPLRHRVIVCAPLLERIDLTPWLGPAVGEGGLRRRRVGQRRTAVRLRMGPRLRGQCAPPEFPSPSTRPAPGSSRRGASTAFAGNTSTPRPARRVSTTARNDSPEAVSGTGMRPQREPHGENRPKEAASGQRTATKKSGPPPEKAEEPEALTAMATVISRSTKPAVRPANRCGRPAPCRACTSRTCCPRQPRRR